MPRIIFFNQATDPGCRELVLAAARTFGDVVYYTADEAVPPTPGLRVVRTAPHRNDSAFARVFGWASFTLQACLQGLSERGRPLLFLYTNPPTLPLLSALARRLKGQRALVLYYDMYPEALERFYGTSPKSLLSHLWRWLNRVGVRHAARTITISPHMADTLRQYWPEDPAHAPLDIVPTWVNAARIHPIPKAENVFAAAHGQQHKLTVLYTGNLGAVHDLSVLPELAERVRAYHDIHFLVIGGGRGRAALEAACHARQLTNVTFLPYQPEETVPLSMTTGDIALVALAAGAEGISMPSKTYYMLAAGCAILGLTNPTSDLAAVLDRHACGLHVPPHDAEAAAAALLALHANPARLHTLRANARRAAEAEYDQSVCIPRLLDIIRTTLN